MRKAAIVLLCFLFAGLAPLPAQETKAPPPPGAAQSVTAPTSFTYNAEGRRDPFKNLLAGRDLKEKTALGESQMSIDDIVLYGIVKNKNVYTALIGLPQGFPMFAKVGDKLADGYVLSITETQAVLRKTHDRGIPLMRPRDIIKEITEEL
jgi:Tfp pilus assembly protein PilP